MDGIKGDFLRRDRDAHLDPLPGQFGRVPGPGCPGALLDENACDIRAATATRKIVHSLLPIIAMESRAPRRFRSSSRRLKQHLCANSNVERQMQSGWSQEPGTWTPGSQRSIG